MKINSSLDEPKEKATGIFKYIPIGAVLGVACALMALAIFQVLHFVTIKVLKYWVYALIAVIVVVLIYFKFKKRKR